MQQKQYTIYLVILFILQQIVLIQNIQTYQNVLQADFETSDNNFTSLSANNKSYYDNINKVYKVETFDDINDRYWAKSTQFGKLDPQRHDITIKFDIQVDKFDAGVNPTVQFFYDDADNIYIDGFGGSSSENPLLSVSISGLDKNVQIQFLDSSNLQQQFNSNQNSLVINTFYSLEIKLYNKNTKCDIKIINKTTSAIYFQQLDINLSLIKQITNFGFGYYNTPGQGSETVTLSLDNVDIQARCQGSNRDFNNLCEPSAGYFQVLQYSEDAQQCSYKCQTCSGSENNCTSCVDPSNRLKLPSCVCKDGYLNINNQIACEKCQFPCFRCSGQNDYCISCIGKNRNILSNSCEPSQGYYESNENDAYPCMIQCSTCTNGTTCNSCTDSNRDNSNGICECKVGFYDDGSIFCKQCPSECPNCTTENNCLNMEICAPQCKTCSLQEDNCTQCQIGKNRQTQLPCACDIGYIQDQENPVDCILPQLENQNCKNGCKNCDENKICIECEPNFKLEEGLCKCPQSFIFMNGKCVNQCQENEFMSKATMECQKCFFYQGLCVEICPEFTIIDNSNNECKFISEIKTNAVLLVTITGVILVIIALIYNYYMTKLEKKQLKLLKLEEEQENIDDTPPEELYEKQNQTVQSNINSTQQQLFKHTELEIIQPQKREKIQQLQYQQQQQQSNRDLLSQSEIPSPVKIQKEEEVQEKVIKRGQGQGGRNTNVFFEKICEKYEKQATVYHKQRSLNAQPIFKKSQIQPQNEKLTTPQLKQENNNFQQEIEELEQKLYVEIEQTQQQQENEKEDEIQNIELIPQQPNQNLFQQKQQQQKNQQQQQQKEVQVQEQIQKQEQQQSEVILKDDINQSQIQSVKQDSRSSKRRKQRTSRQPTIVPFKQIVDQFQQKKQQNDLDFIIDKDQNVKSKKVNASYRSGAAQLRHQFKQQEKSGFQIDTEQQMQEQQLPLVSDTLTSFNLKKEDMDLNIIQQEEDKIMKIQDIEHNNNLNNSQVLIRSSKIMAVQQFKEQYKQQRQERMGINNNSQKDKFSLIQSQSSIISDEVSHLKVKKSARTSRILPLQQYIQSYKEEKEIEDNMPIIFEQKLKEKEEQKQQILLQSQNSLLQSQLSNSLYNTQTLNESNNNSPVKKYRSKIQSINELTTSMRKVSQQDSIQVEDLEKLSENEEDEQIQIQQQQQDLNSNRSESLISSQRSQKRFQSKIMQINEFNESRRKESDLSQQIIDSNTNIISTNNIQNNSNNNNNVVDVSFANEIMEENELDLALVPEQNNDQMNKQDQNLTKNMENDKKEQVNVQEIDVEKEIEKLEENLRKQSNESLEILTPIKKNVNQSNQESQKQDQVQQIQQMQKNNEIIQEQKILNYMKPLNRQPSNRLKKSLNKSNSNSKIKSISPLKKEPIRELSNQPPKKSKLQSYIQNIKQIKREIKDVKLRLQEPETKKETGPSPYLNEIQVYRPNTIKDLPKKQKDMEF